MSQLPDLFPTTGIVDPEPKNVFTPDLPDLYPPGMEPLRPDARAKQAKLLNPYTAVQDIQLGRDAGLDPELVSRNRDEVLLKADVEKMNAGLVGAPGLRAYIHQSPHKMAAVADDVDTLAEIERAIQKGIATAGTALDAGLRFGPTIGEFAYDTLGLVAGTLDSASKGLEAIPGLTYGGLFGNIRDFALSSSKEIQDYKDEYLGLPEELRGRLIDNPQYLVDPQWLIQNVGDAAASLAPVIFSAATSGSNLLGGFVGGMMEGASQYKELIEEGVDPDRAALASQAMVPVVAVLNKLGLDAILSKKLASTFLQRAGKFFVAGTTEALTEYAEEPFGAFFSSLARGDDYDTTVENVWKSFENIDVIPASFLLGGGVNIAHTAREQVITQRADQEQQVLDALTQNIMQSKLGQLDPLILQEVVETVQKGGQIENIYVPASAVASNFESDLQGMSETLNQLGVSMDQFDAALTTGQDLVIPLGTYTKVVASNPEFAARFANDRRLTMDGLTRNEAVQAQKDFQAETARLVQMLKEDRVTTSEYETQVKAIQEELLAARQETKLVNDAARADARMTAATFGVLARMNNVTPAELWQVYGPQVMRGGQPAVDEQTLHQVPPDVARSLNYETKLPAEDLFQEAIANTPGAVLLADGVELDLTRYQKEEQTGDTSVRTGVFYLPTGSPQEKHYRGGKNSYGGKVKIQGRTLLRAPLFVKGATGGKAPEAAYDSIMGKKAYSKMRDDVLSAISGWGLEESAKVDNIRRLLDKYEANTVAAYEIYNNSRQGNTLAYAIQENIVAHAVRRAGYDSVVGYSKKKEGAAFISGVFDVREMTNPDESGYSDINDTFYQSLSTRLPSAVKATEDPLNEVLTLDFNVALSDVKTLEKNMKALLALPNMRKLTGKGSKTPAAQAEAFVNHVVSNLLFLHDAMDPDIRARARRWYDGGRKTIEAWAERYGISEMQGAATIAVLSPQNGWFPNMSQAERIADIVFGMRDFRWDDAMSATAEEILKKDTNPDTMAEAKGKTLEELLDRPDVAARWVRVYDQTHNSRAYRVLTPEGGAADLAQTSSGNDATNAWKSYSTIAKGISILLDGRAENVYYQIGKEHKVRNFYNNLFDPASPLGFTTIDTHAVAAALLRPLAAADTEVLQAFGGTGSASSKVTGMNGTYPLYLEAYKRAAKERGLLPREMQSITWEAVRGLFEAAKKSRMKTAANDIWLRYKSGEIEQDQAQKEIFELAEGVTPPSWSTVPFTEEVRRTYSGPAQAAIDARGPAGATPSTQTRVFFEVAPDPNDAQLTSEWDALPQDMKQDISQKVAAAIVPQVLKELGVSGAFDMQLGGYMGATNPSMALLLDRPELLVTAAKTLGFALSQDSMMVVSDTQVVGTQPVGAVTINLPEGFGAKEVEALYGKLWELEQDGEKLVGGHTTANGQMVVLNFSNLDTEVLARLINEHLGGEFDITSGDAFSAFIDKKEYDYGVSRTQAVSGRPSAEGRADNLRSEATRLLREALDTDSRTFQQLPASLRGRGPQVLRVSDVGSVRASYGEQKAGGSSVLGIHYSREPRESLSGHFYGTGIKGSEARRLALSSDPRLSQRIHFYVDTGEGIRPEPGVGSNIHAVNLNNVYNVDEDPLGLAAAAYADKMADTNVSFNNLESAIIDAGFDGIFVPRAQATKGVVVLLGDHAAVPVDLVQSQTLEQQQSPLGFVSAVETAITSMDFKIMPGKDLANRIKKTAGIKAEELEDLGLIEWLEGLGSEKVTKDQVLDFVRQGGPQIEEVVKGKPRRATEEERARYEELVSRDYYQMTPEEQAEYDTLYDFLGHSRQDTSKFGKYQLPGGKNYREVLLTLPDASNRESARKDAIEAELQAMESTPETMGRREELRAEYRDLSDAILARGSYQSSHWDEPNVLAHVRLNDRTGPNGERILFVEEIQSDWHQEGRKKGYNIKTKVDALVAKYPALPKDTTAWTGPMLAEAGVSVDDTAWIVDNINALNDMGSLVPSAPFKKSWAMLAFKRVLRMAAEQGYDSVSWTPGDVQAERYDLSKQVESIGYQKRGDLFNVTVWDKSDRQIYSNQSATAGDLENVVGKEIAQKIADGVGRQDWPTTYLEDLDLKVGGEGMKGFYDKILPNEVNKYVKKWGVKVGVGEVDVKGGKPTDYADFADYMAKKDGAAQQAWSLPITEEMRQDILGGQALYQQQAEPQAAFTFKTASGKPLIELFEKANQSSFLHETGHLYLEMIRDMALKADAPQAMVDLWSQTKAALRLPSDGPISREAHEEWSRNLEAYFAKGEAPSLGLRGLFAKYAEWLKGIYREVENIFAASGTEFNPDLKPIFDRLFATEQEMQEVEAFYAAQRPFFDSADQMSEKDRADLKRLRDKAQEASFDSRLRKLTEAYIKSQGGRKALAEELRAEVEARRVYTAIEAARDGGFELSEIDYLVGEETRKAISKKWKAVKVGGDLDPNVVAAQNGYDSAREMLLDMAAAPSKQQALKDAVDQRVEAERQTILRGLLDADSVVAADEAYHNEDRLALLVAEFTILAEQSSKRQGAQARALDAAAAREVARQTIQSMPLSSAMKYQKFARAERNAAIRARDAKKAGRTADALKAKREELLNHALFMESMKLRGQIQKLEKAIKKGAKQKSMLPDAKDLLQGLGIQYGLMPYNKQKKGKAWAAYTQSFAAKGEERPTLSDWAAERENEFGVYFDPFVLQNAGYVPLQALTVEQFDAVRQAVNTIKTVDRNERTVLVNGQRMALEAAEALLEQSITGRKMTSTQRSKRKSKLRKMISGTHAFHAKMESMLLDLDNWSQGHWWNMLFKPIADAENARSERLKDVHAKLQQLFEPVKKGMGDRVFIPEINDSLRKSEILAIALNMGNEGNILRLKQGFPDWDLDALFQRMTQTEELLTAKDWKFVQDIWDYFDSFRPESFALQKYLTGREPERIMPTPLTTMHGVLQGGYYPAAYDTDLNYTAFSREQKDLDKQLFGGRNYGAAMTQHSHLKERAATGAKQALSLDLGVITDHLYNTVHDLTHRKAVVEVAKIMKRPKVRKMVEDALSPEAYREFMPWLQDVAQERQEPMNQLHRAARWARKGTTIMQMGLKFTTMITQPLGIFQTLDVIGPKWSTVGLKHVYGNSLRIHKVYDEITTKSTFMNNRIKSFDREVRDAMKGLTTADSFMRGVQEFSFKGIGYMQLGVDMPTWWGAYQKGLSENLGDEAKAVDYADSVVRISQGSGATKDLARVQRGGEFQRLATMFYSYFSALYSLTYRRIGKTKSLSDIPTAAGSALALWFLPAIMAELIAGRGPDDDEEWWSWGAGLIATYPFLTIVGVKDIASAIESGFDYQMTPAASAPGALVKWGRQVYKAVEEEDPERAVRPTVEAVGYIFQLPLKQPVITLGNIWDYMTGEDPEFEVRDLFFVKPKSRR